MKFDIIRIRQRRKRTNLNAQNKLLIRKGIVTLTETCVQVAESIPKALIQSIG